MKLVARGPDKAAIGILLKEHVLADYVYMYPPRQAYRPFPQDANIPSKIAASLDMFPNVNLYFHFPFCAQICAFCNLFTTVSQDQTLFEMYIGSMERELRYYAPWLRGKRVETVYLGGGTPSLMTPRLVDRLLRFAEQQLGFDVHSVAEVAMEVSPETVNYDKLVAFRAAGINRINLGVQTAHTSELEVIGRQYDSDVLLKSLDVAQSVGFTNICVDLIYGLQGQTFDDWKYSVDAFAARAPDTICAYALTLRPFTGFSSRSYRVVGGEDQLRKYDYCRDSLVAAGYHQQTHVRWARNARGGYLQKENHWALQNVMGFGAGARSYLWHCDVRNGYSVRNRNRALRDYMQSANAGGYAVTDGFIMDDEERIRKALVLGLIDFDVPRYSHVLGVADLARFKPEIQVLEDLGLLLCQGDHLELTVQGVRHRDALVQLFFSDRVKRLLESFEYAE